MTKDEIEIEKLKLVYPPLIQEINRYRDWPIRILTFTSAIYFGLIGLFLLKKIEIPCCLGKGLLTGLLTGLTLWTICHFIKCHLNYLKARNTQVKIQKKLKLDQWLSYNEKENKKDIVFPCFWFKLRKVKLRTGWCGWGFYAFYTLILFLLSIMVIWGWWLKARIFIPCC